MMVAPPGFLVTVSPRRVSSRLSRSWKVLLKGTVGSAGWRKSCRAARLDPTGLPSIICAPALLSGTTGRYFMISSAVWTDNLDQSVTVRAFDWKVVGFGATSGCSLHAARPTASTSRARYLAIVLPHTLCRHDMAQPTLRS